MEKVTIYTRENNVWTITNGTFTIKESLRVVEFSTDVPNQSLKPQKIIIPLENIDSIIKQKD
jgi:hypothetical protein